MSRLPGRRASPLQTWRQALDDLDATPGAKPAHVMRFGTQININGIDGLPRRRPRRPLFHRVPHQGRRETYADPAGEQVDPACEAHIDRLHAELRYLPVRTRGARAMDDISASGPGHDG